MSTCAAISYSDPGEAALIFKIDGKEVLNQEFAYYDEKSFTFESDHKWTAGRSHAEPRVQSLDDGKASTGEGERDRNPSRLVRQQADDRRPARERPVGQDRRTTTASSRARCPAAPSRTPRLRARVVRRVRREGVSPAARRDDDDTADRLASLAEDTYRAERQDFRAGRRAGDGGGAVLAPLPVPARSSPRRIRSTRTSADVDEYSLASRLSYFLWSTMPDDELIAARRARRAARESARAGQAHAGGPARRKRWRAISPASGCRRATSKASPAIRARSSFAMPARKSTLRQLRQAWRAQDEADREATGRSASTRSSIPKTRISTATCARRCARKPSCTSATSCSEDRPVTELIDSNYTFVNEKLAKHYGIPGVDRRRSCARSRCRPAARAAACSRRARRCWSPRTRIAPRR